MTLEQFHTIGNIQIAFYFLGAIFSFIQFQKREMYVKLIGVFCVACAFGDLSSYLLYYLKLNHYLNTNANYGASIFYILCFPILSFIYYLAIGRNNKRILISIAVFYFLFGVLNLLFIQKETINSYSTTLLSIIIITYCLYYFYWLLKELPTMHLHGLPMFWINSAFMVYFSGNLFLFVFTSYLVQVLNSNLLVYWSLHNFLGIIEFSLIIFALWIDLQNIKSHSS